MKTRALIGIQHRLPVIDRALIVLFATVMFRCAPIASELQSARLVGRHQAEVTASYATMEFRKPTIQRENEEAASTRGRLFGVQAAYGLSDRVDLRVRVEQFRFNNGINYVFSVGPKVALVRNRLALYAPIWFADFKPAQTQPSLLVSIPVVRNKIEFNPSVKSILTLRGYDPMNKFMVAMNFGFALSNNLNQWAIRPEFGVTYDLKGHHQFGCFAIGFTRYLGKIVAKR